ncbi:hypothetical protein EV421DRAFT_1911995 [Armillaria borealis]|uniref:Uncharacterized protein n=1 Tax=Armillaria borealis TaxID=47425 RepID=A0AA39IWR5_9AGAR|nr:hypothetical protein EV421DRAFT_1911995 [Armillaria borealis]
MTLRQGRCTSALRMRATRHLYGHRPSVAQRPASIAVHRIRSQGRDFAAKVLDVSPPTWTHRRRVTVLVNWDDAFAVAFDAKLRIAGETVKKSIVLLTARILGEYAGEMTGCVHVRIERDPIHEMDVVNAFKVQNESRFLSREADVFLTDHVVEDVPIRSFVVCDSGESSLLVSLKSYFYHQISRS